MLLYRNGIILWTHLKSIYQNMPQFKENYSPKRSYLIHIWVSTNLLSWQKPFLICVFWETKHLLEMILSVKKNLNQSSLQSLENFKVTWQKWWKKKKKAKKFGTDLVVSGAKTPQLKMLDVTVYKSLSVNHYIVQTINIYLLYKRKKVSCYINGCMKNFQWQPLTESSNSPS